MTLGPWLAVGVAAGLALGAFFFGGLLWTVRRLPGARAPGLLIGGSLLVRMAPVIGGFLLLARVGSAPAAGAGLLGFLVARLAVSRAAARVGAPAPATPTGRG